MFNIIDRYIAKNFLIYFFASIVVFVTLFLAVDFMTYIVKFEVPLAVILEYFLYQAPLTIYQMIPVSCMVATVFSLTALSKAGELVALFASGMSLARVCAPILILVGLLSGFTFWMSDQLLPKFTQKKNYVLYVKIKKTPGLYSTIKTNKIWYRSENVLFNIQSLNAPERKAQGLTLYYFDPAWNLAQVIVAKDVSMEKRNWTLSSGNVTLFSKDSSFPMTKPFRSKNIIMNEDLTDIQLSPEMSSALSIKQLQRFIKKNKESGLDTINYEIDFHAKFSFAFAGIVMALMGIPFSIQKHRSGGNLANGGMCLGLTFVYWALYSSFLSMGKFGLLPPFLAAWAANILLIAGSMVLLVKLKR